MLESRHLKSRKQGEKNDQKSRSFTPKGLCSVCNVIEKMWLPLKRPSNLIVDSEV